MAKKKQQPAGPTITCSVTGETIATRLLASGDPALPRGWKRLVRPGGEASYLSLKGLQQGYVLRCLTVPVERVARGYGVTIPEVDPKVKTEEASEDWMAFRRALCQSWRWCAQAANLMVREIAVLDRDSLVTGRQGLLTTPAFSIDDAASRRIYTRVRQEYPQLDSQSMGQVFQNVKSKYMKERFDVRVRGAVSLPSFRYPMPLPCPAKDSPLYLDDQGRVCFKLRISGERFSVRIKSDPKRFGRQSSPLQRVALGELLRGDVKIRSGDNGQVLLGTSVYVPREFGERSQEVAFLVRTDPASLLVGEMCGRTAFVINADEVLRWQVAHANFLQRMSQDRKAERRGRLGYTEEDSRRSRKQHARNTQRALETRCDKHERRMSDALHKIACTVANHAQRRKVGTVIYDELERTYMPSFPYAQLRTLIEDKLAFRGIVMIAPEKKEEKQDEAA